MHGIIIPLGHFWFMNGFVDLDEVSHWPSNQVECDMDGGIGTEFVIDGTPNLTIPTATRGGRGGRAQSCGSIDSIAPLQSRDPTPHKIQARTGLRKKCLFSLAKTH